MALGIVIRGDRNGCIYEKSFLDVFGSSELSIYERLLVLKPIEMRVFFWDNLAIGAVKTESV